VKLQLHLEVEDSPNSAGISIDAVRCCMLAKDKGISGAITAPSSYFFKHPPVQYTDDVCRVKLEDFIAGK
jgi:myo-inositol-1-phosphate synthase